MVLGWLALKEAGMIGLGGSRSAFVASFVAGRSINPTAIRGVSRRGSHGRELCVAVGAIVDMPVVLDGVGDGGGGG